MTVSFPDCYRHFNKSSGFIGVLWIPPSPLSETTRAFENGISFACRESHWSHLLIVFYFFTAVMYRNINISGQKVSVACV